MYTAQALLDALELTHRGHGKLLGHCAQFNSEELQREIAGFGYPTLQRQLHHIYEAEQYWIDVLSDRFRDYDMSVTEDIAWKGYMTIESIQAYAEQVMAATRDYLSATSDIALNTPAEFLTWPDKVRMLVPARVVMRLVTHPFHHRGQAVAMCRLLGRPAPPLDFPITAG